MKNVMGLSIKNYCSKRNLSIYYFFVCRYHSGPDIFIYIFLTTNWFVFLLSDVLVLTVATNSTCGYKRFLRSAKTFNIPVKTLGFGAKWRGGSMVSTGGGHKVNLLREEVAKHKKYKNKIIIFTDR